MSSRSALTPVFAGVGSGKAGNTVGEAWTYLHCPIVRVRKSGFGTSLPSSTIDRTPSSICSAVPQDLQCITVAPCTNCHSSCRLPVRAEKALCRSGKLRISGCGHRDSGALPAITESRVDPGPPGRRLHLRAQVFDFSAEPLKRTADIIDSVATTLDELCRNHARTVESSPE